MNEAEKAMGDAGKKMYAICEELFPICRSITGDGVRETFQILKKYYEDIKICEIPCGTQVFDWTIPKEWNIKDAYIEDEKGERVVDFGAFISLEKGGEGLLHISKISKDRIEKASDVLSVGQELEVKVLKVQKDRIELGLN